MADFYSLPRELRDHVYKFYFEVNDGYAYNFSTGKLTTASGRPIELALRFVSRLIRDETCGLALELNSLHFSSDYHHSLQERAGHFNALLDIVEELKTRYLVRKAARSGCFNDTICAHVESRYPQYTPLVQTLKTPTYLEYQVSKLWGETPSASRQFVASTLAAIAAHPQFPESTENPSLWAPEQTGFDHPRKVIAYDCKPWKIPTEEDIVAMRHVMGPENRINGRQSVGYLYHDRFKYRFSAASMAISFLDSLSLSTQLQIRKIVLHEEKEAVAWPQCHAQGFIPFCQRNSKLRIERRVDLWKAILPAASYPLINNDDLLPADLHRIRVDRVQADFISSGLGTPDCIASWIMEALSLQSHGMPPQSFRLVIDGGLTPTQSTRVFDVVKRDAAWQTAFEACLANRKIWPSPPKWHEVREREVYIMHGFPEALRAMINGQSPVSCNFDIGKMPDTEALVVEQGHTWTLRKWDVKWRATAPADVDTDVPSRSWVDLQRENLLPPNSTPLIGPMRLNPGLILIP